MNGTTEKLNRSFDSASSAEAGTVAVADHANAAVDVVQKAIRKYPAVSLGIAVATGLAIGWMVKRR